MLVIRAAQSELVGQAAFVEALLSHVRLRFAAACESWTDEALRGVLRDGLKRAVAYGLDTERSAARFVNLMVVFGRDFDRDEAWAREVLESPAPAAERASRLYALGRLYEAGGRGLGAMPR